MVKDVQDWEILGVLLGIRDPDSNFNKIKQKFKDPERQKKAMIHHWHSTHPLASWSLLHQALQMKGEIKIANLLQQRFLKGILSRCVLYFLPLTDVLVKRPLYKVMNNLVAIYFTEHFPKSILLDIYSVCTDIVQFLWLRSVAFEQCMNCSYRKFPFENAW